MLSLNLLSPTHKQALAKKMILLVLERLVSWFFIIISLIGITLLLTKLVMQNSFNRAVAQGTYITQEYGGLNQRVLAVNQKTAFLSSLQKSFVLWSSPLGLFTSLAPKNIELYSLNINEASGEFRLNGYAKHRDVLLLYKSQLTEADFIKQVDLPIEYLLEAENINFNIKGKISL